MPLWLAPFPAAALGTACGLLAIYLLDGNFTALADDAAFFALLFPVAFAVVLGGLLVVGLPLTLVLRRIAHSPWSVLAGALIGGVAGRIVSGWLNVDPEWATAGLRDSFGFPIGAFSGLFWALFTRKRLVRMQEAEQWSA